MTYKMRVLDNEGEMMVGITDAFLTSEELWTKLGEYVEETGRSVDILDVLGDVPFLGTTDVSDKDDFLFEGVEKEMELRDWFEEVCTWADSYS